MPKAVYLKGMNYYGNTCKLCVMVNSLGNCEDRWDIDQGHITTVDMTTTCAWMTVFRHNLRFLEYSEKLGSLINRARLKTCT